MARAWKRWLNRAGRLVFAWAVVSAVLGGATALYAVVIEPRRIVVEHASIEVEPRANERREGSFRLVFVSDFDMTQPPGRFERRVRETVNGLDADLVAVGGDFFGGNDWTPPDDLLAAFGEWLAGFRSRHGMVVVWGEQEAAYAAKIRERFPPHVRDLDAGAEVVPAGAARVRIVGPGGLFPPLSVESGRLAAGLGKSMAVARYRGPGSTGWAGVEVLARIYLAAPGDTLGFAVLEAPSQPGLRFRVDPVSAEWGLVWREGVEWTGRARDRTVLAHPRQAYNVRIRVEPAAAATRVRSKIWPIDRPEPEVWGVDLIDTTRNRTMAGTIAVLAGGTWTGSRGRYVDALEVRDLAGSVLLSEGFDDPDRFARDWENPGFRPQDFDATVLIAHNAGFLLDMPPVERPFELALAGHTHGGQVRLPLFGPLHLDPEFPRSWSAGLVPIVHGRTWLYVSRGLSSSYVPVRLNCTPEVTEMTINIRSRPPQ